MDIQRLCNGASGVSRAFVQARASGSSPSKVACGGTVCDTDNTVCAWVHTFASLLVFSLVVNSSPSSHQGGLSYIYCDVMNVLCPQAQIGWGFPAPQA